MTGLITPASTCSLRASRISTELVAIRGGQHVQVAASQLARRFDLHRAELAHCVKNHVVGLSALGEILLRVIDHSTGAQGAHQLQIRRAAHPGHSRPEVPPSNLHRVSPHRTRCAVDEHFLPAADVRLAQAVQGGHPRAREGGRFPEGQVGRLDAPPRRPRAGICTPHSRQNSLRRWRRTLRPPA